MVNFYRFALLLLLGIINFQNVSAQCGTCTAVTFNVNLSAATDTSWSADTVRNGDCCTGTNCVRFIVAFNPASDLLNFTVTNPAPSGAAYYQINCGPQISIGTPACITGMTSPICITYCKPGGDNPNYNITATRTVEASGDITIREGCTGNMTVNGMQPATITWTSIAPGLQGAYNSYLSCTSGCASTNVTPTAGAPTYVDYMVSGSPTTACGGTTRDTVRVYMVPGMNVTVNPANPVLCSGGPGSVTLSSTVSGGNTPYAYTWSNGSTGPTATVSAPGTYTLSVTDNTTGCAPIVVTKIVTAAPTPAPPIITSNSPVCAGSTITFNGETISGATYSWTGPNGFVSSLEDPSIANASSSNAGTYNAIVTVAGCTSAAASTTVTVNPIPAAPFPGSNSPVCETYPLNLTASPVSGATYTWTGPNGFSSSAQNPTISSITAAGAGAYTVNAVANGCPSLPATTAVIVSSTPGAPAPSSNAPICAGSTLNLFASPITNATYSWTGPNGFTSTTQNPSIPSSSVAATGTYSVTATVNGCTGPAGTLAVTINPIPSAPFASSNGPICANNTLNLFASPITNASYSWTGPNGFSSSLQNPTIPAATTAATGTYSVTATVNGCTGPAGTVGVTVNPIPGSPSPSSNSPVCQGSALNLFASPVVGATYSWTGPNGFTSTSQNPSIPSTVAASAGTYTVIAIVNGCGSASAPTPVTITPIPIAPSPSSNSPICAGNNLNLFASTITNATYSWTGPNGFTSTTQNPTIPSASTAATGTYSVTATVNGCTGPAGTVSAIVNTIPTAPVPSSNSPVCAGSTLTLFASTVTGASYTWTGPNGFTSAVQNPTIPSATIAATGTYTVRAIANGCSGPSATVAVIVNTTPAAPAPTSNSPICAGSALSLSVTPVAGLTYSWTGPNGFSATGSSTSIPSATTAATGTYSVTASSGTCVGPAGTTIATVRPIPASPAPSGTTPVCEGSSIQLFASSVSGATYSWSGPNGFTSTSQNPTIPNATTANTGTYTVNSIVNTCPSLPSTVSIVVNAIPLAPSASSNSPICAGSSLDLNATGVSGAVYSWTGPNGFSATGANVSVPSATIAATGTYSVSATVNGCTGPIATIAATVNPIPATPSITANTPICQGNTLSLSTSAVTGASYSWSGPNGFSATTQNTSVPAITSAGAGTYTLVITVNGCSSNPGTRNIVVNPIPSSPASNGVTICSGNTATLTASGSTGTYQWYSAATGGSLLGSGANFTTPVLTTTTTYYVQTTVLGCPSPRTAVTVTVNPTPAAPTAAGTTVCQGSTATVTATAPGGTYNWFDALTGGTLLSTGASHTTGALSSTDTIYVQSTINGCTGPRTSVIITVTPTDNSSFSYASGTYCITGTNPTPTIAGTYPGTFGATPAGLSINASTGTITLSSSALATYTVSFTTSGPCPSTSTQSITITNSPNASFNYTSPVCQTGSNPVPSFVPGASAGVFSASPAGLTFVSTSTGEINLSSTTPGTYTITNFIAPAGGCASATASNSITIDVAPIVNAGSDQTICAGDLVTLSGALSGTATSATWSGGSGTFSNASSLATTYTPSVTEVTSGSVTLFLTSNDPAGPCAAAIDSVVVTINPIPPAPAASGTTICSGNTATLAASGSPGTYAWYTAATGGVLLASTPSYTTATLTLTTTYYVESVANGCSSPRTEVIVKVNAIPSAPTANSDTICTGTTATLTATAPGGSYEWFDAPIGGTLMGTGASITTSTLTASTTYYVETTVNGCVSARTPVTVTVSPIPPAPTAGNPSICSGSSATLTATGPGGTYQWLDSAGTVLATASSFTTPVLTSTTTYFVHTTVNGCTGPSTAVTVTVNPIPSSPTAQGVTICEGNNATLTASATGGIIRWFAVATGGTALQTGSSFTTPVLNTTTTYYVQTTVAGCTSARTAVTVTVIQNDDPSFAYSSGTYCISGSNATPVITGDAGGTFTATPAGLTLDPSTGTITPATSSLGTYSITYTTNGQCPQSLTVQVTITNTPDATFSYAGPFCQFTSNPSPIFAPGASAGVFSATPTGLVFSGNGMIDLSLSAAGTYNVTNFIAASGGCASATHTTSVAIQQGATVNAGSDLTICTGANANLSGSIGGTATAATWSGNGIFADPTSLSTTYSPTQAEQTAGTAILVLTTSNPGGVCSAVSDTIVITIISDNPSFTYSSGTYCITGTNPVPVLTGGVTGTFTATPAGLTFVNASTGEINLGASSLGTYTIQFISNGPCPDTAFASVTITNAPDATFSYSSPVCQSSGNIFPVFPAGSSAGLFSSSSGLVFTDPVTGEIDVPASVPGTYSITNNIAPAAGCAAASFTSSLTIDPAATVDAGTNQVICAGSPVTLSGSVGGGANSGTWQGAGTFNPGSTTLTATYTPTAAEETAGSAMLILTTEDPAGPCLAVSDTIIVTINPIPAAPTASGVTICEGSTATLTATAPGGTYSWFVSATGGSPVFTGASFTTPLLTATTTYYVEATIAGCSSASRTAVVVTVNPKDDASFSFSSGTYCISGPNPAPAITGGGMGTFTSSPTGLTFVNTSTGEVDLAQTTPGTYTITFITNGTCPDTATAVISIVTFADATFSYNDPFCTNGNNPSPVFASGASPGVFSATPAGLSFVSTTSGEIAIASSAAGTYVVTNTIAASGGCNAATHSDTITINPGPVISVSASTTSICSNNPALSLIATIQNATGVIWLSNGDGVFSPDTVSLSVSYTAGPNDISNGTVILSALTTGNGLCNAEADSISITVTPGPFADAGPDTMLVCQGTSIASLNGIISGSTTTGIWSSSGTGVFNPSDTSLTANYIFSSADIAIGSVTLVLTSTNNGSCLASTDTMEVLLAPVAIVNAGADTAVCSSAGSVQLSGTVTGGATQGVWSTSGNGSFIPSANDLNASYVPDSSDISNGSVTLTLNAVNSCAPVSDQLTLVIESIAEVNAGPDSISVCSNVSAITINGTITGFSPVQWTTSGTGTFTNATSLTTQYIPSSSDTTNGSVTLILQSASTSVCPGNADTIAVWFRGSDNVSAGPDLSICSSTSSIQLNGTSTGGTVIWTTSGTGTFAPYDSILNPVYNPSAADLSSTGFNLIISTVNSCTPDADTILVTVGSSASLVASGPPAICSGETIPLTATVPGTFAIQWTSSGDGTFAPSDTVSIVQYTPGATDLSSGNVQFILSSPDTSGCQIINDTIQVTIQTKPAASFTFNDGCEGAATTFTNISSGVFSTTIWKFGTIDTSLSTNTSFVFPSPGTFNVTLIVTTSAGCSDSITQPVTIDPAPRAGFIVPPFICSSSTYQFNDTSKISSGSITGWIWDFGDGSGSTDQSPDHVYTQGGTLTVSLIVTTPSGCTDTASTQITVTQKPVADFIPAGGEFDSGEEIQFTNTSVNASSWTWTFTATDGSTEQNPTYTFTAPGTYTVMLKVDNGGCEDTSSHTFTINDGVLPIGLPTAFTPNGDGVNDVLYVRGGPFTSISSQIFTEWGNLLFDSQDQNIGWDGTYKEKAQPAGKYIWIVKGVKENGETFDIQQEVTLIR